MTAPLVISEVLDAGDAAAGIPVVYALWPAQTARLTVGVWRPLRRLAKRDIARVAGECGVSVTFEDENFGWIDGRMTVSAWAPYAPDAVEFLRRLRCWANRED